MKCLFDLADPLQPVGPGVTGAEAYDRFQSDPDLLVVPVVNDFGVPVGLLERNAFALKMAGQYGRAVFGGRPVSMIMDDAPVIVDGSLPIDDFMRERLMDRPRDLLGGFVVTRQGRYAGVGSALSLLQAQSARIQSHAAEAQAALRAKSEFLAVMSHEIRTPLNGVLAVAEVIQRRLRQEDLRPFVGAILGSGQTLLRLLSDALDLSRAEAGRLVLQAEPFQIAAVVDDLETLWRPRANEVGVTFSTLFHGEDDLWVLGDAVRLKQVLNNLVGNALKFTKAGRVDVSLSADGVGEVVILKGEVRDTGPGVDPAQIDRLFTPFGQTEAGRRAGGAGLGLSICRQLVEKMGGQIGVESRLGEGSTFRFEIILETAADPAADRPAALEAAAPALDSPHVLVVDDNATNRLVAETLLEMMGCSFASVEDGAQAVDRVRGERFDLVLMDVKMPVMDGLEATRRIRAMPSPAGAVPIIALTANADPLDAETYRREGMDAVVEKPIRAELLLQAMSAVLEAAERAAA
ncbi:ATP-binding protein [Caulobacter sp. KR2-114]|uniref:ATP-binding protein n=1 Tax=Caulobacter sp. KR2-114 TaxID=3400912 RepID=UPI003C0791D7